MWIVKWKYKWRVTDQARDTYVSCLGEDNGYVGAFDQKSATRFATREEAARVCNDTDKRVVRLVTREEAAVRRENRDLKKRMSSLEARMSDLECTVSGDGVGLPLGHPMWIVKNDQDLYMSVNVDTRIEWKSSQKLATRFPTRRQAEEVAFLDRRIVRLRTLADKRILALRSDLIDLKYDIRDLKLEVEMLRNRTDDL